MRKKSDKSVTEKLNEVYQVTGEYHGDLGLKYLKKARDSYEDTKPIPPAKVGIDMGDPAGDKSVTSVYLPCPHCNKLINLESYKGLFFDEYLNRIPKEELQKLVRESFAGKRRVSAVEKEGDNTGGQRKKEGEIRRATGDKGGC